MNAVALLEKHFASRKAFEIVLEHSRRVADKALKIAGGIRAPLDLKFIEEAALLHDIGVSRIHAPQLDCHGSAPYIRHGVLGREILDAEGFIAHGLVCERHIGVGLTVEDIIRQKLPLPHREMRPLTMEERIVSFADLYYSKTPGRLGEEKAPAEVMEGLRKFGAHKASIFREWLRELNPVLPQGIDDL
ncbi:MAG: hypothetical protein FD174_2455 [Geobacteraceae bacterium]|nr:MAG: hypothetical protein FD174_2455 [Geobacteraceae bacterium]